MARTLAVCGATLLAISGCETRSISDPGYRGTYYSGDNRLYRGELSEFEVLGIDASGDVSDDAIARALANKDYRVTLRKGDRILLIQSGAMFPDQPMTDGLSRYFSLVPFTGIPERQKNTNESYSRSLRLAAANAVAPDRGSTPPTAVSAWARADAGRASRRTCAKR